MYSWDSDPGIAARPETKPPKPEIGPGRVELGNRTLMWPFSRLSKPGPQHKNQTHGAASRGPFFFGFISDKVRANFARVGDAERCCTA